jgi:mRNA interferase RelE/StbE
MGEPFKVAYATEAADDIRQLRAFDRRTVLEGIERYLMHEPGRISRSRIKLMIQPFWSQYRLRLDEFRVYYDLDIAARRVSILRVLKKTTASTPQEPP